MYQAFCYMTMIDIVPLTQIFYFGEKYARELEVFSLCGKEGEVEDYMNELSLQEAEI